MKDVLISIIIPVYNASDYLRQCLESVIAQTYSNIEVICVNDGSTDKSQVILEECARRDERMTVIDINNNGVSNARNIALGRANGSMIMFVDADDWLDENCLEALMKFNSINDCDIVMFPYKSERENNSRKRDLFSGEMIFKGEDCKRLARFLIGPINDEIISPSRLDSYGTIWGKLYKKEVLDGLSFEALEKIGTAEDSLFNMFAFKHASKIGYCPEMYYHYRRSNVLSLTNRAIPQLKDKWKNLFDIISNHFTSEDEKSALSNRIALGVMGLLINAYDSSTFHQVVLGVLNDATYHTALQKLNTRKMPIHWRLFYYLAKKRQVRLIELLLSAIQLLRRRSMKRKSILCYL